MALVFVHGIGNRDEAQFIAATPVRDGHFRKHLLPAAYSDPVTVAIESPPWGRYGGRLHWNHASLTGGSPERLGGTGHELATLAAAVAIPGAGSTQLATSVARSSVRDAVDLLFTAIDFRDRAPNEIDELVEIGYRITNYCRIQEKMKPDGPEAHRYPWLSQVSDDADFIDLLLRNALPAPIRKDQESLGAGSTLGRAGKRILTAAADGLQRGLVGAPISIAASGIRSLFGENLSLLLGDVFAYLQNPNPIVDVVAGCIEDVSSTAPPGQHLIVVAHSMGGNIVYDILSRFRPKLHVDTLVTVGSQVGLFAEMGLFEYVRNYQRDGNRPQKVPQLKNVDRWINVLDRSDILAYRCSPIFEGVADYEYPTNRPWAHSAYFKQPNFHARLGARITEEP
ncbi:hypothetical protein ABZ079_09855 [Streptomyces sp. NPDC006314]|uniref:hypothetical protein n=1 Tax=Streptomyces sp. NPDC006314 TaxID=3154475 RepID=UPI0033A6C1AA